MKVGSLFAGIGGFDLGLERAGFEIAWQVEIDPYCQRVLAKHWPNVQRYGDIKQVDWHTIEPVDLVCGGFPCQPFSLAGKRKGFDDDRYLWPEVVRCLDAVRPTWFLGENVPGIIKVALDQVCADLESLGYAVQPIIIPACAVDAPHIRQRVWIVADADTERLEKRHRSEDQARACATIDRCDWWAAEPELGRVAHGIPHRVDRLRGLGNSIVPQIAEWLGRQIMSSEQV